ncbi:unnamed protein product [Thlaspi arvense]|uniref:NAC domain-containing protein n=1 Tax=Thlaspi arvense TaxID=13288 RepID=A0AAU9SWD1_THLAR|nr:unnamed protein product [Thlaspi arvense]
MGRGFVTGEAFPAATSVPPTVLFHPTDEELVSYYLKRKVMGKPRFDVIGESDINKLDPCILPGNAVCLECYFFSAVHKYRTGGTRVSRATIKGYWRQSGKDKKKRGYVLCRLFQKNGIRNAFFLGNVKADHFPLVVDANGKNKTQQENQSQRKLLIDLNTLRREFEIGNNDGEPLKRGESAAQVLPICVLNKEAPLPIIQYKRKRQDGSSAAIYNNSRQTTHQDHCSSTTTTVDTSTPAMAAALLEFSLRACSDKEKNLLLMENNPELPAATMAPAASSSTKLIYDLQKEKDLIAAERDKLKSDLIEAEMMQNILQGQINALREENEELRKNNCSNNNMELCF